MDRDGERRLPDGTVTFVLTDIEGSTRLWEEHPDAMRVALERHNDIIATAVAGHHGTLVRARGEGDSTFSVFADANDAIAAAVELQLALHAESWTVPRPLRVRAAIHTGFGQWATGDDYPPIVVNRCARLRSVAAGGQTLVTETTFSLVDTIPPGTSLADLGVHRLRDLNEPMGVYQLEHASLPSAFPPLRTQDAAVHALSDQLAPMIGREEDLRALAKTVTEHRAVTLTGAGGVGKSRLALAVAADLSDDFRDGARLVDFTADHDEQAVLASVASAIGAREQPGRAAREVVLDALCTADLLLVLDTCEHVLGIASELVAEVVGSCPGVSVLATSRERLAVPGGVVVPVRPLEVPDDTEAVPEVLAGSSAVRMFLDRAGRIRPDLDPDPATLRAFARLASRVDGLPLAIELLAARLELFAPIEIEERFDDRIQAEPSGSARHGSLERAIQWSHDLLSARERAVFRRVSVCEGFDLAAAEAVATDDPVAAEDLVSIVASLVTKSLVERVGTGGRTRYRLLDTVRAYAADQLGAAGEELASRDRHLRHFVARLADPSARSDRADDLRAIADDYANIRAAHAHAVRHHPRLAMGLAVSLADFWHSRSLHEDCRTWTAAALAADPDAPERERLLVMAAGGSAHAGDEQYWADLERAVEQAEDPPAEVRRSIAGERWKRLLQSDAPAALELAEELVGLTENAEPPKRVQALALLGVSLLQAGRPHDAEATLRDALDLGLAAGVELSLVPVYGNLGAACHILGEPERELEFLHRSLAICRNCEAPDLERKVLSALATAEFGAGDLASAERHFTESLDVARRLPDPFGVATCTYWLGNVDRAMGRLERAAERLEAAADRFTERGDLYSLVAARRSLADVDLARGRTRAAAEGLLASHDLAVQIQVPVRIAEGPLYFAPVLLALGRPADAARLHGCFRAAHGEISATGGQFYGDEESSLIDALDAALAPDELDALRAEGAAMSVEGAVAMLRSVVEELAPPC